MTPYERQKQITDKIEEAKIALSEAAALACDLAGWCTQWEDIGNTMDEVTALWWRIHQAPQPGEPVESERNDMSRITLKTEIRRERRTWAWSVLLGETNTKIGGGYGRTKLDAEKDAGVFRRLYLARATESQPNNQPPKC